MALENRRVMVTKAKITRIANAIREKKGTTDAYELDDMPEAIRSISGRSGDVPYGYLLFTFYQQHTTIHSQSELL